MKTVLLILILTSCMFPQEDGILSNVGGKVYFGVSAGPAFPLGDYGDDNPNSTKSGFAKTGYTIELNAGIRLLNLLEISFVGFRNDNGTDLSNLVKDLNQSYPGYNFTGNSDSWVIYGAMFGFGLSYPAGNNLFADFKILGGYINSTSPEISLTAASADTYLKIEGTTGSSIVYYFSGALRRPLTGRLHASLGLQYTSASTRFYDVKKITSIDGEIDESLTSFTRAIDAWGIMLGLKYFIF